MGDFLGDLGGDLLRALLGDLEEEEEEGIFWSFGGVDREGSRGEKSWGSRGRVRGERGERRGERRIERGERERGMGVGEGG